VAAPSTGLASQPGQGRRWLAALLIGGVLIFLGLIALRRRRLYDTADLNTERVARDALIRAAKTGNAAETYRALTSWLDYFPPPSGEALDGNAELFATSQELRSVLFGGNGEWSRQSGIVLARAVAAASPPISGKHGRDALPPLNPVPP